MVPNAEADLRWTGSKYGGITAKDNSVQQNGDIYGNVNYTYNFNSASTGKRASDDLHEKFLDALFVTDPRKDRQRILQSRGPRTKGTCQWITAVDEYRSWLNDSFPSFLWISGEPGRGKTFLSTAIAEDLTRSKDQILIEYYCDNSDEKRNSASAVVRGLIYGLLRQCGAKLSQKWKSVVTTSGVEDRNGSKVIGEQALRDLSFESLWPKFVAMLLLSERPVFCIIDGLDECSDTSIAQLTTELEILRSEQSSVVVNIKMIVVSRPLRKIDSTRLESFPCIQLNAKTSDGYRRNTESDVELMLRSDLNKYFSSSFLATYFPSKAEQDKWRSNLEALLLKRAQGTFLWAGFALRELRDKSPIEVSATLEALPSGLDAMHDRILLQIDTARLFQIAAIIRWVVMAVRPLSLVEVGVAASISASPGFTIDQVVKDYITHSKGLLVTTSDTVGVVHQSFRDYLFLKRRTNDDRTSLFRLDVYKAEEEITRSCIDYLQGGCLAEISVLPVRGDHLNQGEQKISLKRESKFPLLRYALVSWPEHAQLLEPEFFSESRLFFQKTSPIRDKWFEIYKSVSIDLIWVKLSRKRASGVRVLEKPTLLHLACFFGLPGLVKMILQQQRGLFYLGATSKLVNVKDHSGRTPLDYALDCGHDSIVQLLIDAGARIDGSRDERLLNAAMRGQTKIVPLLIAAGADICGLTDGLTPLQTAAQSGHTKVVEQLIAAGAPVDARDADGAAAIYFAAQLGSLEIVELLIEAGADVNSEMRPLPIAALMGHQRIAELLLAAGADINAQDTDGHSALYVAVVEGKSEIVEMLLEEGADMNVEVYYGEGIKTPLQAAIKEGHDAIAEKLLTAGANVNVQDGKGYSALYVAAELGSANMVRQLLAAGAAVNIQAGSFRMSPLLAAVGKRGADIAQMLLAAGAHIDAVNNLGRSALFNAVLNGHLEMAEMLIKAGADVDKADWKGRTPLQAAAFKGYDNREAMIKLLIAAGAEIDTLDDLGRSILFSAAERRDSGLLELLLEAGADVNKVDRDDTTPLFVATCSGRETNVQLLLAAGANVNATDANGMSALYIAAMSWQPNLVEMLLDAGANVNLSPVDGDTPLRVAIEQGDERMTRLLLAAGAGASRTSETPDDQVSSSAEEKDIVMRQDPKTLGDRFLAYRTTW